MLNLQAQNSFVWDTGYHLCGPAQSKAPASTTRPFGVLSALALDALAFLDIQDHFVPARPTIYRQVESYRVGLDAKQAMIPPAYRASDPTICYRYLTTNFRLMQLYFLLFYPPLRIIKSGFKSKNH